MLTAMRTLKLLKALALSAAAAVALSGCSVPSESSSEGSKHLNFVTVYPANTTDPHVVQTAFFLTSGTVETLVALEDNGTLKPGLATQWSSDDAITWTFTIRDGVSFHNGKKVDAAAVKQSLEHSIAVNDGMAKLLPIQEMAADGQTLTIVTSQPYPGLPSDLVHYNTVILDTEAEGDTPVGTGAFKFESLDIRGSSQVVRFDDYWDGAAKLDSVSISANEDANARLLALQSGEADLIYRPSTESLEAIEADSNLVVDSVPGTRVYHVLFNQEGPTAQLWADENFRKGVNALIDRDSIAQTVMSGQGVATVATFRQGAAVAPEPYPTLEVSNAKALEYFQAAGLEVADGKVTQNGQPISMQVATYVARPELPQIAQVVQHELAEVGIEVQIHTADNIDEHLAGSDWDMATYSVNTLTRGDGSYFINGSLKPGGAQNHGKLDDAELNALIEVYNSAVEPESRVSAAQDISMLVFNKAYNAYIVAPNETAAHHKKVTGWKTPSNEFEYPMITKDLDIE